MFVVCLCSLEVEIFKIGIKIYNFLAHDFNFYFYFYILLEKNCENAKPDGNLT